MNEAGNERLCYIKLRNDLVGEERCEIKLKKTDTVKEFLQKLLLYTGLATSDDLSKIADADYENKRLASGQKEEEKKENEEEAQEEIRLFRQDIIIYKNQFNDALTHPDNYNKTLSEAGLWDTLSKSVGDAPVTFRYMLVSHSSKRLNALDWCDQQFIEDIRALEELNSGLKELPYYEIVSSPDAANPSKKINSFQACDNKKMKCTIIPTTVKYGSLVPDMKATNPFHRFIFSDYLRKQKLEGRLSNAENIFNREIGGFDTMTDAEAKKGNIKDISMAAMQKGWQGIDKKDYIQVHYNGNGWDGRAAEYKDALGWYTVLDNVILDKAYLSFDSNLDILICDAQVLFDKRKINFDQMQNIVLMLRYAYELRKLPNEKNGELNLNIKPINLNSKSKEIIDNMCTHLCRELMLLLSDQGFEEKITKQISTMIDENDEVRRMMEEAQGLGNEEFNKMVSKFTPDLSPENARVPVDNLVKIFQVYAELTKRVKELKNEYRSKLLKVLSKSDVPNGRMKNIEAYDTEESDFIKKLKKECGNLAESLNLNQDPLLDPLLLDLEEQIDQKSDSLKKLGEITKSSECQKIVEYLDSIRVCVNYVDGDLNLLQRLLNCLLSLFGLLDFQIFKIGVNFNNEKTIFAKYNARDAKAIVKANHDLVSDELGY